MVLLHFLHFTFASNDANVFRENQSDFHHNILQVDTFVIDKLNQFQQCPFVFYDLDEISSKVRLIQFSCSISFSHSEADAELESIRHYAIQ